MNANQPGLPTSIDIPFHVPFVHRLRFTGDIFGGDRQVLADLLEPADGQRARAQFWLDANVAAAHPKLEGSIQDFAGQFAERVVLAGPTRMVPGGEPLKNDIHALQPMLTEFNAAQLDRSSYVVVIGGGAVLDTVGLAAAIAHRGLRLIRLPTTTLAQADSGVGVKNGVNLFQKKNWLGSFAVPWAVVNDAQLLSSLPDREFHAGFSEAVKVALLKDPAFFEDICRHAPRIHGRDMAVCLPIIRRAAELHLQHIVHGGDPFEMREARPLDFGHWSAHKLEAMSGFALRHGEAVAIGLAIDVTYASLALGLEADVANRVIDCLIQLGFALNHPQLNDIPQLLSGLEEFRQHLGGQLTLTMVRGIGQPVDIHQVDLEVVGKAIRRVGRCVQSRESIARDRLPRPRVRER